MICYVFFFKQKTAYEMRISDWSSDVCSSDLSAHLPTPSGVQNAINHPVHCSEEMVTKLPRIGSMQSKSMATSLGPPSFRRSASRLFAACMRASYGGSQTMCASGPSVGIIWRQSPKIGRAHV